MVLEETLNFMWQVYYYIAIFATILFAIKLIIFSFTGGGSEVACDFNTEFDVDTSFDFISLQTILAFLMGFGWAGFAASKQFGIGHLYSFLIALAVGLIFMFTTALLMFGVKKLEKNVKKDKADAIGKTGKAYTTFDKDGKGKVEVEISGQLAIADAINTTEVPINSFDMIEVVGVKDNLLQVKKVGQ